MDIFENRRNTNKKMQEKIIMEILVCIKQVPDDSVEISLDEATGKPALDGVTPVVNAFDTYAEEMAVRLKEAVAESEVTVVSIGDDSVKNSLKNCLAVGADHAYLVKCDEAENLDGAAVAKVLAKAKADIEAAEGKTFDLIFCGKESTDYAASQTGLLLAAELNVPAVANVVAVETADGTAKIRQETETGYNEVEASMPCVVTIQKPNYDPRYPTIKSKMAARKKPIGELETGEIPESSMEVVKVYAPAKRQAGVKIKAESPEESVAQAMKLIADAKVL